MSGLARAARAASALCCALALGACATAPATSADDPFEPMNRAAYRFHDTFDRQLVRPWVRTYVQYTPKPVQTAISNFFGNIDDFFSGVAGLLQGKWDKAGDDFGRVTVNTLVLGGLVDVASQVGIERGGEDFGQVLGFWGVPQGPYFFVPFLGPTTLRDGTGWAIRYAAGPIGYLIEDVAVRNVIYGVNAVDIKAALLEFEDLADRAAIDRYVFIRRSYLQRREYQLYDGQPPRRKDDE
jgi:phospholipid-binding lipoprotein MlaA